MKQNNRILLIGTTAECVYNFRKDLILALVAKGYRVYAFTTDNIPSELEKISALGATPVPYMFSRGGLNPLNEIKNTNVSKEATQSLINRGAFNQNNVITVYNGIDIDKFSKLSGYKQDRETIRFISIGRFNEQKDYPNLLNAITKISSKKNLSFDIVGDGELRPVIEDLIQSLDIADKVKLLGRRSDIPNLLNNSDFFVLPSAYEGFGLVVAEAMACGAFVIATNSGGVAEVMGDTGILVPPQDSQALAQAMQQALSLKDEQISSNNIRARKRIEELFSLEKSVEKWLEIYEAK